MGDVEYPWEDDSVVGRRMWAIESHGSLPEIDASGPMLKMSVRYPYVAWQMYCIAPRGPLVAVRRMTWEDARNEYPWERVAKRDRVVAVQAYVVPGEPGIWDFPTPISFGMDSPTLIRRDHFGGRMWRYAQCCLISYQAGVETRRAEWWPDDAKRSVDLARWFNERREYLDLLLADNGARDLSSSAEERWWNDIVSRRLRPEER